MLAALKRFLCREGEPCELFTGDAHAVMCGRGLSDVALTYLSVPSDEWYSKHGKDAIGLSIPRDISKRLPADLKEQVKCWYFRADLPIEIRMGHKEAWRSAKIEQVEDGVWCVWFSSFSGG